MEARTVTPPIRSDYLESSSAFSWRAALAGAAVAAALALILLILGTGFGLTAVSPWANDGASAKALGIGALAWLIFIHLSSAALGGYMAGRLRTRWTDIHSNEVFFRDTAHGLVAWAVGIILSAALLGSAATAIVGSAAKVGAGVAGSAAATAAVASKDGAADASVPFVDELFRSNRPREAGDDEMRAEVGRLITSAVRQKDLSAPDKAYVASLVAARTGLSQEEADKRVTDVMRKAQEAEVAVRQAADEARKALIHASIWTVIALMIGGFAASYAATVGGRHRDAALIPVPL